MLPLLLKCGSDEVEGEWVVVVVLVVVVLVL